MKIGVQGNLHANPFLIFEDFLMIKNLFALKQMGFFLFAFVVFYFSAAGAANAAYSDIYQMGWNSDYQDATGAINSSIEYNYKDLFGIYFSNPNDPYKFGLRTAERSNYNYTFDEFCIYIPPGTVSINMCFYLDQYVKTAIVLRYGQPPTGDYSNLSDPLAYVPYDSEGSIFKPTEINRDMLFINRGGHIAPFAAGQYSAPLTETEAGWLYVKVLKFEYTSKISNLNFFFDVDLGTYRPWYNDLSNFDTTGNPPLDGTGGGDTGGGDTGGGDTGGGGTPVYYYGTCDNCDVNQDGIIDLKDAIQILQYVGGGGS